MTPDFDKIQAGNVNRMQRTEKKPSKKAETNKQSGSVESFAGKYQADTGVVGRSAVKMDTFDTSLKEILTKPVIVAAKNRLIDKLVEQGYSLEDATSVVYNEFDF